eukprot:Hpha_TRINITY_DN15473_c0_g2::TRINITY_DN15473_c0_g2_i1::g.174075::m.174075/K04904/KCNH1; potassium voltage-gated channel Eag-related subfamily H member 1
MAEPEQQANRVDSFTISNCSTDSMSGASGTFSNPLTTLRPPSEEIRRDSMNTMATGMAQPPSPGPFGGMQAVFQIPQRQTTTMISGRLSLEDDSDADDEVDHAEITQAEYNNFLRMFNTFDADRSGTIDIDELGNIMLCLGVPMGEDDVNALMQEADPDKTGEITLNGFVELMCRHKERLMKDHKFDTEDAIQRWVAEAMYCAHYLTDSSERWWMDGALFVVISYYLIVIPLSYVTSPTITRKGDTSVVETILESLFHLVFFADIALRLRTLHPDAEAHKKPPDGPTHRDVAITYLKGPFALDLLTSLPLELPFQPSPGAVVLRSLKLLKFLRVPDMFSSSQGDRVLTARYVIFLYNISPMMKLVLYLSVSVHVFCVIWLLLTEECSGEPKKDVAKAYLESLYTVLYTLTTVGYGNVTVKTDKQRIFACLLFIAGAVINGFVISEVSRRLQNTDVASERKHKMVELVSILQYFRIPRNLQYEILAFQYHTLDQNLSSAYSNMLESLPKNMQDQLSLYVRLRFISRVPFFSQVHDECKVALAHALQTAIAQPHEFIICAGEVGEEMFFLGHGVAEVLAATGSHISTLGKGNFFGEMALLFARNGSQAKRTASVRALSYCDLFKLKKDQFLQILSRFPRFRRVIDKEALIRKRRLFGDKAESRPGSPHGSIRMPSNKDGSSPVIPAEPFVDVDCSPRGSLVDVSGNPLNVSSMSRSVSSGAVKIPEILKPDRPETPPQGGAAARRFSMTSRASAIADCASVAGAGGMPMDIILPLEPDEDTMTQGSFQALSPSKPRPSIGGRNSGFFSGPSAGSLAVSHSTNKLVSQGDEGWASVTSHGSPESNQVALAGRAEIGGDMGVRIDRLERLVSNQQLMMEVRFAKLEELLNNLPGGCAASTAPSGPPYPG